MEVIRTLRLKITFGRNPTSDCLHSLGKVEHWAVTVWEVNQGSQRWDYNVEAVLEYLDVIEKWDGGTRIPAHREFIPGVHVTPSHIKNFHKAVVRARELALVLSGYMTSDRLGAVEEFF